MATICLSAVYRPLNLSNLASAGFFGYFGANVYFAIRCNLLCMTSGESSIIPTIASPSAAFFSASTAAMIARPALPPRHVVLLTGMATLVGYLSGLAEEENLSK
jgi:hypothetical protein